MSATASPIRPAWIVAALAIVAAIALTAWLATCHRVWYDRPLPLEGEATYNDFYAVQQALRAQGLRTEALPHLQGIEHWSERDSLLLGSDARTLSPQQVETLLDWVARGGRLLVATGQGESGNGDVLLERIGVAAALHYACFKLRQGSDGADTCFAGFDFRGGARPQFDVAIGDDKQGWILGRRSWGLGQIEVVGSLDPLRLNDDSAHAHATHAYRADSDWDWQLLSPLLHGGVLHVVYQSELPPLYVYLVRYGWYALLPALLVLLGWLWACSQRFGPAAPLPEPDRRALGEHIQASGEYLYRQGLVAPLYEPLRRRFDEQLRRRDPELAALPPTEIGRQLAQRHHLPVETVLHALRPPQPKQRKAFLASVQTLLQLIRRP